MLDSSTSLCNRKLWNTKKRILSFSFCSKLYDLYARSEIKKIMSSHNVFTHMIDRNATLQHIVQPCILSLYWSTALTTRPCGFFIPKGNGLGTLAKRLFCSSSHDPGSQNGRKTWQSRGCHGIREVMGARNSQATHYASGRVTINRAFLLIYDNPACWIRRETASDKRGNSSRIRADKKTQNRSFWKVMRQRRHRQRYLSAALVLCFRRVAKPSFGPCIMQYVEKLPGWTKSFGMTNLWLSRWQGFLVSRITTNNTGS